MKIHPVGASCFMRTDGQTGRRTDKQKEANNRFSQF